MLKYFRALVVVLVGAAGGVLSAQQAPLSNTIFVSGNADVVQLLTNPSPTLVAGMPGDLMTDFDFQSTIYDPQTASFH